MILEMADLPDRIATLDRIWERLAPMPSERAVLSAVYETPAAGMPQLRFASLLIGPAAMTRLDWSDWNRRHLQPELAMLPSGAPGAFAKSGDGWTAGRTDLTLSKARRWVQQVLIGGEAPPAGPLPAALAAFRMASAPVLARSGNRSPASSYVLSTVRPVIGYFFPALEKSELLLPQWWPTDDHLVLPWFSALGIDLPTVADDQRISPPSPPGLLIGRVSRTAWLNSVRYDGSVDRFVVGVWLEPKRADFHRLLIDVREYVDGEIAFSARTDLSDVRIPARARGRLWLNLPTLGRGLQRAVSLYERDGTLLDHRERFAFIERCHVPVGVMWR
jgi:hypothetical protein